MIFDKEKVIKAIEICYTLEHSCTECPLFSEDNCNDKLMHDALALLNEQEERIGVLTRAIKQMPKPTKLLDVYGDGYAKIVRCKHCTHTEHCEIYGGFDGKNPDWFCADGKGREA